MNEVKVSFKNIRVIDSCTIENPLLVNVIPLHVSNGDRYLAVCLNLDIKVERFSIFSSIKSIEEELEKFIKSGIPHTALSEVPARYRDELTEGILSQRLKLNQAIKLTIENPLTPFPYDGIYVYLEGYYSSNEVEESIK